jgi:hypothetical protein
MEMEDHKEAYRANDGKDYTGWEARMRRIVDSEDGKHIIAEFKDLIRRSYGKRDGDRFLKSQDIWEDFASTEAFSQLLYDICTDTDQAIEFWNGLIPKDLDKVAAELQSQSSKDRREHYAFRSYTDYRSTVSYSASAFADASRSCGNGLR